MTKIRDLAKRTIIFGMAFGMMLLGFQSCKKAPPTADQPDSAGIVAV